MGWGDPSQHVRSTLNVWYRRRRWDPSPPLSNCSVPRLGDSSLCLRTARPQHGSGRGNREGMEGREGRNGREGGVAGVAVLCDRRRRCPHRVTGGVCGWRQSQGAVCRQHRASHGGGAGRDGRDGTGMRGLPPRLRLAACGHLPRHLPHQEEVGRRDPHRAVPPPVALLVGPRRRKRRRRRRRRRCGERRGGRRMRTRSGVDRSL